MRISKVYIDRKKLGFSERKSKRYRTITTFITPLFYLKGSDATPYYKYSNKNFIKQSILQKKMRN